MSRSLLGEWLDIPEEGIEGLVTEVFQDEGGEFVSAVIITPDGKWAAVDLTGLETEEVTLH